MTRLVRPARWGAAALAALLASTACGGTGGGGRGDSAAPDGSYSVALTEPDHLTPGNTTSSYSIDVLNGVFDTLVTLDPADGHPVMQAAQSVTSTDQRTWTVRLRPGQTFQNGEKVTARSFVDAWNAAAYGPNGWANNYYFANVEGYKELNPEDGGPAPRTKALSGLRVVDDLTFTVRLTAPFSPFPMTLAYTGFAPLPRAAFTDPRRFDVHPIGNGPFAMDGDWQHNQRITLKKYAGYRGPRPAKGAGVVFRIYASKDTAWTDFQAGRVDLVLNVPPAHLPQARRLLGDRLRGTPSGTMDYLGFPVYDKRFADPRLRKAFSMAIDRRAVVDAVFNGAYQPMASLLAPNVPGYRKDACGEACTYDPAKAKQLLAQAGGFHGPLELWFSNADSSYEQWMTAVANQLRQNLGIDRVAFRKVPASDYLSALSGRKETGPYRNNWVMDYPSAQDYLEYMWGDGNRMGWHNQRFLDLLKRANSAPGLDAATPLYQQAEDIALAELPMAPLWNWTDYSAWSERLRGVRPDPYVSLRLDQITVK
ncbi:ABC transporter substrate-binding protein [Streptacidiphilus sp. ASG 303]|uniref:peptide ABC transporter substrate-binding protein n=1 Tax=Streptacidiphilus sp. ASG 303 TaxID=2896847 RepID=UPI001E6092D5|nr:ABC transporter substrate-binding protein [Streptacidiphilus sp. ASG 303]MCD0484392.1 ABC transporter substrate-binding protein [Streptacidiphilus sp. ASG 303]